MRIAELTSIAVLALALAASTGCKKKSTESAAEGDKLGGNTATAIAVKPPVSEQTPALTGVEALKHIPKTAALAVAADGLGPWLDRLGYAALRKKHAAFLKEAAAAATGMVGVDATDPASWPKLGLDPKGSIGFAWLNPMHESVAFWFTTSDPAKLEATLKTLSEKTGIKTTWEEKDAGKVMRFPEGRNPRGGVLIAGKTVIVAVADGQPSPNPLDAVLALKEADSLANSKRLAAAMKELNFGDQVAMFADLAPLLETIKRDGGMGGIESKVLKALVGDDLWLSAGFSISGKTMTAKAIYGMSKNAGLTKIVESRPNPVRIVQATRGEPVYLFSGSLNLGEIYKMVKDVARSAGGAEDFEQATKAAERALSMSIEKDVLGIFTGEVGFSITGKLTPDLADDPDAIRKAIDGNALIGINGGDKLQKLLDLALALPPVKELVSKDGDTYIVPIPEFKSAYITVTDNWIAASTDKGFAARAQKGGGEGFASDLEQKELSRLLTTGKTACIGLMDYGVLSWFLLARKMDVSDYGDDSPERKALREQLRKQEDALEKDRMGAIFGLIDKLGIAGGSFWTGGSGFVGYGGLYMQATPADLLAQGIDMAVRNQKEWEPKEREIDALRDKLWQTK